VSDDLDLRGIDHRQEPDPQFRAALQRRLAAIVAGTDPGSVTSPVQFSEEEVTMIDVKTTDPTEPRQKRPKRVVVAAILAAAAAVVAIAFVATSDVDVVTPADEPSTTVPSTPLPRALPNTGGEQLVPGTYFVAANDLPMFQFDEVTGIPTARILFTIDAGRWRSGFQDGRVIGKWDIAEDGTGTIDLGFMVFSRPYAVFSDACHAGAAGDSGPVATVDGLVAALIEQRGWADVTAPSDISVDGYAGKAFQRTVPADISDCETAIYGPRTKPANLFTTSPRFRSWEGYPGGLFELYEPGEVETLWVLDIDGTVVVIHTRLLPSVTTGARALAGPSAAARADFAAVLDSIRIDKG
jgi:hypothetical protein